MASPREYHASRLRGFSRQGSETTGVAVCVGVGSSGRLRGFSRQGSETGAIVKPLIHYYYSRLRGFSRQGSETLSAGVAKHVL